MWRIAATLLLLSVPANEVGQQEQVELVFNIEDDHFTSSISEAVLMKSQSVKPGLDANVLGAGEAIKKARSSLAKVVSTSDKWICVEATLHRHKLSDHWYWYIDFYSPDGETDIDSCDHAVLGVTVSGEPFIVKPYERKAE